MGRAVLAEAKGMNANPLRSLTDKALTALYESLDVFVLVADLPSLAAVEAEMYRRGLA